MTWPSVHPDAAAVCEGLVDKARRSFRQTLGRVERGAEHKNRERRSHPRKLPKHVTPAHDRHGVVQYQQMRWRAYRMPDSFFTSGNRRNGTARLPQHDHDQLTDELVVVIYQDGRLAGTHQDTPC